MSHQLEPTSAYRQCQSLVKGLDLLAALNRSGGGMASITELSRQTGIHRTTVKRLLETLADQRYVETDTVTGLYRLSFRVHHLSYGYRDSTALADSAWPHMRALSKAIVWPCSLLTLEGDEMVVRVSTRSYSPLSFHPGMPGRRMPLLTTAAGRAYLAYAPEEEVQVLLGLVAGRSEEPGARVVDESFVRRLIEKTRRDGYGTNQGEWSAESKFGAVSVPLRHQGRVLACLNVIFLMRALDRKPAALKNIVTHLQEAGAKIEERFAALRERPA